MFFQYTWPGSQIIGMAKDFYQNLSYVKDYFAAADDIK